MTAPANIISVEDKTNQEGDRTIQFTNKEPTHPNNFFKAARMNFKEKLLSIDRDRTVLNIELVCLWGYKSNQITVHRHYGERFGGLKDFGRIQIHNEVDIEDIYREIVNEIKDSWTIREDTIEYIILTLGIRVNNME